MEEATSMNVKLVSCLFVSAFLLADLRKVWKPPNAVAVPLPSTYFEAEKIGFIPVPATKEGEPVSKYFKEHRAQLLSLNVRDTADWKDSQDDPAFLDVATDCDYIPFEDLIQRRNELWGLDRNMDLESEEGEVQENDDYRGSGDYFHSQAEPPPNEHASNATEEGYEPDNREIEEDGENSTARATEARLAALGVTGMAKPVRALTRPVNASAPATVDEQPQRGANQPRSRSPREYSRYVKI
jgi:hypothetical protein